MKVVIGIDPSLTHTGIAYGLLNDAFGFDQFWSAKIKVELKKYAHPLARLEAISARLESVFEVVEELGPPGLCMIEGYAFGSPKSRSHSLAEWGGQVRLTAYRRGWVLCVVPPTTLKKYTTGNGRAEKNVVLREVHTKWGYEASNDNDADAFALMQMGATFEHVQAGTSTKKDRDLVKAVELMTARAS